MSNHFENLWETSEKYYLKSINDTKQNNILDELIYKAELYKSINDKDISKEEKDKIKSHLFGEILMTLTQLSLKEDINSYKALYLAIKEKGITD